jgi:hypothetical protein
MAIFDEAYQYVMDDVARPEYEDIIKRRIQRAVLSMHRIDFWMKDFVEQIHAFQYNQAVQVLNTDLYPKMRSVGYIRKFDGTGAALMDPTLFLGAAGNFFKEKNPQMAMDGYGDDHRDVMYRSGTTIKLQSASAFQNILFGWFRDPLLSPIESCDSWILEKYPSLIAALAKRRIFKDIGKDAESRSAQEEYMEELLSFQANNIRLAVLQMPGS